MNELIKTVLDDGTVVYIECSAPQVDGAIDMTNKTQESLVIPASSSQKNLEEAEGFFNKSMKKIMSFSSEISKAIKETDIKPDSFDIEFGAKFSAEAGIVFSSVGSDVNLVIKMHWNTEKKRNNGV